MNQQRLISILSGEERSGAAACLRATAALLEPPYRLGVAVRNAMFDRGLRRVVRLPRPVISVGNLTTGGTGKTPMVIELARRLQTKKTRVAILIRGYKGSSSGGSDEVAVLAEALGPEVPVEADADRAAGAQRVLDRRPEVDVFLLDDGFQHRQIARDLNIVLIDATAPFGFGHLLPRGLLREPPGNLRRADALIVTRADQVAPQELVNLDQTLARLAGRPPLAHAAHVWEGFCDQHGQRHPAEALQREKVLAVSGIGNPQAFAATLARSVGQVVEHRVFPDHHAFNQAQEISQWISQAVRERGATAVVTTEKDWVKWRVQLAAAPLPIPIYRPMLKIRFLDGAAALDALLHRLWK